MEQSMTTKSSEDSIPLLKYDEWYQTGTPEKRFENGKCINCGFNGLSKREHCASTWSRQEVVICPNCGSWKYWHEFDDGMGDAEVEEEACSKLISFKIDDPQIPIDLINQYLAKHPNKISHIHHFKFEEVISSIYKEVYGYEIITTKQTRDNGVDLFFFDANGTRAAVQVKQRKNPQKAVGISVLRDLIGAAVINKVKDIHLVTNARFSKEVKKQASKITPQFNVSLRDFKDIASALDVVETSNIDPLENFLLRCPLWLKRNDDVQFHPLLDNPRTRRWP